MTTAVGRENGYQDPPALELEGHVSLEDPLERTAIVLHRMTFATPEDAAGLFSSPSGRDELTYSWRRLDQPTRRLYRLRADVALDVHARGARA